MNKKHLILVLITAIVFSTASYANNRHERHSSHQPSYQSNHRYDNINHRRNNMNNNYYSGNIPFSTYGYNQPYRNNYNNRNRFRNQNFRQYRRHQNHNNNYRRHNNFFNNYQPYYQSQYTYRPLRGLGHYYTDNHHGYGHWHDNSWCATQHPQNYYFDYYSNYPYQNGWAFGDGDFGLNFFFNY